MRPCWWTKQLFSQSLHEKKKGIYEGVALVLVNRHSRVALAERLTKIPAQNCNVLRGLQYTLNVRSQGKQLVLFSRES